MKWIPEATMALACAALFLTGCGHMDEMIMGGLAGAAAGTGAPLYGAPSPHYPHYWEADSPSWDALQIQSAINAQTQAIQSAAANAGY